MPRELVYDGQGFYDIETREQIFYRQFLRLLCQENYGRKIIICIVSEDIYSSLKMFSSLLCEFKTRNNGLDDCVGKYKVIAFSEIEKFKRSPVSKNVHLIFHWLNPK